jgi:hypothetical protein
MTNALANQTLRFVQVASALGKRAMDELSGFRQAAKVAQAKQGPVLDQMVASAAIQPHQKEAAASMLATHADTLELLTHAVAKIAALQKDASVKVAGELGRPGDPEAAVDPSASLTSPFVGARTTTKKASDRALLRGLGLPTD